MRESRTYGFVRGVPGDWHPYRDSRPGVVKLSLPVGLQPENAGRFDLRRAKCNSEPTTIADHLYNELVLTKKRAPRPFSTYQ